MSDTIYTVTGAPTFNGNWEAPSKFSVGETVRILREDLDDPDQDVWVQSVDSPSVEGYIFRGSLTEFHPGYATWDEVPRSEIVKGAKFYYLKISGVVPGQYITLINSTENNVYDGWIEGSHIPRGPFTRLG